MKKSIYLFIVLILIVATIPFWPGMGTRFLVIKNFETSDIAQLLTTLFLIALFVERSLDVFLTTWRAPVSEHLTIEIDDLKRKIAAGPKKPADEQALKAKIKDKQDYIQETRKIALWSGLVVGVLISAVGFRSLMFFISATSFSLLDGIHENLFTILDVLITGGLIAGGSDGIHKIMDFYRVFMEKSAELRKNKTA